MGRGKYYRYNAKTSTDDVHSVSMPDLKKFSDFKPGVGYALRWSRGGKQTGAVNYDISEHSITFRYTNTPYGGEPVAVRVTLSFTFTPCRYGGHRKWFVCHCGRGVTRLFIKRQRVACRHCLNLVYSSQKEDQLDRLGRKIGKKKSKLTDERHRPKGMHHRTFKKLRDDILKLELQKWQLFETEFARRFPTLEF